MTDVKETVRTRYAEAAKRVTACGETSCCGGGKTARWGEEASRGQAVPETQFYDAAQVGELPEKAVLASLGCGNPTALAELKAGETVLDLGSGGGIDVLLSARRVGPAGKAYGLDMTDEMLDLARRNQADSGIANAEFLKGHLEDVPLPDASVDVVVSNCVINLSADKRSVVAEALRLLRPGGRLAVADVVADREPDAADRAEAEAKRAHREIRQELRKVARAEGMRTLQEEAARLIELGVTTPAEVLRSIYVIGA